MCYICVIKHDKQKMEIVLKLYTYVDGTNDTPFPNAEEQAMFTFTYEANRMAGSPTITATVKHRLCLDDLWTDNVYAMFNGVRYYIMNTPSSSKDNEDARYEHDLELMSEREILNHVYFIDAVQGDSSVDQPKSNTAKVQFFGDVNEFAGRLNACFQYQNLNYTAVVDEGVESEDNQVSFEDKYILEALQEIYNVYEIPYYFVGNVVHIGYSENTVTYPLKYGFDEALLSISKENANYALINKIKGQGSSDNIPYYYPNNSPKGDIGIRIISGSMVVSNFIIYDYEKFASSMSTTDTCTVRQVTGESGVISFVWSMNGKDIELSDIGIRLAYGAVPKAGSSFGQSIESYITPSDRLMPSIYRETKGAEQFYEAKNNTYEDGEGGYYYFENEYSGKNPRQGTTDFEDIKPTIKEMTNASGQRIDMFTAFAYDLNDNDEVDEEGKYIHPYFFAKLRKFDGDNGFNLFDQAIEGQAMTISFTSGACGACSFEIGVGEETEKNIVQVDDSGNLKRDENGNVLWENQTPQDRQNDTSKYEVWIALKKDDSTYSYVMPNVTQNIKPSTSDTFVILGINLPTAYITAAEKRLEQSLIKYMWMNNTEKFTFSIKFSRIFFTEHPEVLEQLNENSRVLVEYNGQQHTLYVDSFTYRTDESSPLPEITVDLVDTLSIGQNSLQTQLDSVKQDILSSIGGGDFLKQGLKYFIRKDIADTAQGKITFNSGLQSKGDVIIGKNGFAGGLSGFGAKIGSDGRAEMRALRLWEFLEVPELRYNSVKVFLGIDWQVAGAGIIESCTPDTDSEGNELTTGTCTLKLEEGQYGAIDVDDIALGIWHFGNETDATEDSDDGKGNFTFAGFATSYFRITEVSGTNNETFKYSLRPGFKIHPQSQMTFACYGNFTNEERQTSTYRTRTYTRRLWKQNTWEIGEQNIAMQDGDLSNLSIFGLDMTGYSMYVNSVYFTGTVSQIAPDGTPVMTANDRGAWQSGTTYNYYDRVSHNGSIWLCVNENGTNTEPSESNPNWLLQVSKGETGQDGKDGTDGEDGKDGKDGKGYEYIFKRTTTYSQPSTPTTSQTDDYVPSGWTDDPQGVSMTYLYEWVSQRTKTNGTWSSFSTPSIWAKYGETGETGALARYRGVYNSSDTYIYDYENDVLVRDIVVYNGQAYQVKTRGDSVTGVTPSSTSSRWEQGSKFSFVATDTALIDNANVAGFIFRNLGFGSDGTPYGELRSQNTDSSGSPTLYMNTKTGYFYCSNATIQGALKAGSVGDFTINKGISNVEDNPEAFIEIEKNGGKYFRVNKGTEDAMCSIRADSAKAVKIQTYENSSSSIGLDISANTGGYGYAIRSRGNVLLDARPGESVGIYGLRMNVRKISSSTAMQTNDDFIEFNNTSPISFNMSSNAKSGKVIYMKKVTTRNNVTLNGKFRDPNGIGTSISLTIGDEVSRMFVFDGNYWVQFFCG